MELSLRLKSIADFVPRCAVLADVGTDHAYIPIYLLKRGIIDNAIGTDISKGSVEKAKQNCERFNLSDKIQLRCGDGLEAISQEDRIECIVISGMGGMLAIDVMKKDISVVKGVKRLILQPQRDVESVRRFIHSIGMRIVTEKMLIEDDKFYNIVVCENGVDNEYGEYDYRFGKVLIEEKNTVLKEYIIYEMNKMNRVLGSLDDKNEKHTDRKKQVGQRLDGFREVLSWL